jgi:hypothetical protein
MPMRQLRACDFCGGDAAGVYEVLPPELSPTEAEQRRVVLCADCLETLETVVDPLLNRLGIDGDADADPTATPTERAGESTAEPTARSGQSSEEPTVRPEEASSPANAAAEDSASEPGSDASGTTDSPRRSGGSGKQSAFNAPEGFTDIAESDEIDLGGSDDSPADSDANGVADAAQASGSSDSRERTRRAEVADDASGESTGSDDASGESTGPDETASPDASNRETTLGSDRNAVGAEPDDFRTVMRLLGNREFPIRRDEVVDLAAGAYDLDEAHVERIVDHAIDRGVLADEDGTLTRS